MKLVLVVTGQRCVWLAMCNPIVLLFWPLMLNIALCVFQFADASYDFNGHDADPAPRDEDPDNWYVP